MGELLLGALAHRLVKILARGMDEEVVHRSGHIHRCGILPFSGGEVMYTFATGSKTVNLEAGR